MLNNGLKIRKLTHLDWESISRIYDEGLKTGIASFETGVPSWKIWNEAHDGKCRLVVTLNEQVIGYSALLPISKRPQFLGVAQVRIYVASTYQGMGVGSKLLKELIKISESLGYWTLHVSIFKDNLSAIRLHKNAGFVELGVSERLAKRGEVWHDVVMLQRRSLVVGC